MQHITLLACENAVASSVTGVMDLFNLTRNRHLTLSKPDTVIQLVTLDGNTVPCSSRIRIEPHGSIESVQQTDLLIICAVASRVEQILDQNKAVIPWIQRHHEQGSLIASICTGAFFLAEAGLLDGKPATTHWFYKDRFEQRYPKVRLNLGQILTSEGNVFCAAGGTGWCELSLMLIERYWGKALAIQCAKFLLLDMDRTSQVPYSLLLKQKSHQDSEIVCVQQWLEQNYEQDISIEQLSQQFGISTRTLKRRFKNATDHSLITYLQLLRIEAAKRLLENSQESVEEITFRIGYEDVSFFRKLFKRHTQLSPLEYRQKFHGMWINPELLPSERDNAINPQISDAVTQTTVKVLEDTP